uniref:Mating-type protein MAT-1 n=1 Tax=Aureobasidium zeae TaxID=1592451 RepID=A0A5P8DIU8_9PEZI|nr:MAT1-1-1 [Aureobasidium zeae]
MSVVMPESIALLLQKYSPEQIAEVVDAVMKMRPVASQQGPIASPTPSSAITDRKKRAKKSSASKGAQSSASAAGSIAPTRPLNSWMAFRSYHSPIFKSFQQKDISGFLTRMWQNDPFKAKWSILAKAYSMIRENNTKDAAPLDKFLAITCPLIGMIPRDEYLVVMGWNIVDMDGGKKMERFFTPEISSFPESILTTNLSSEDLVTHCLHISYVQQADDNIVRNQGSTAALSMAAQPTYSSNLSFGTSTQPDLMSAQPMINSTQPIINSTQPIVNPTQSFDTSTQAIFTSALPAVLPTQTASSPMQFGFVNAEPDNQIQQAENINHGFLFGDSVQGALFHNNNGAAGASGAVRQAVHDLGAQEFPFMDEFDPFGSSALDFDPFSMNHDAAFASNSIGTYLAPSNEQFPENFNIDDLLSSDMFDMTK